MEPNDAVPRAENVDSSADVPIKIETNRVSKIIFYIPTLPYEESFFYLA